MASYGPLDEGPLQGRGYPSEGRRALKASLLGVLLGLALVLLGRGRGRRTAD